MLLTQDQISSGKAELSLLLRAGGLAAQGPVSQMGRLRPALWLGLGWVVGYNDLAGRPCSCVSVMEGGLCLLFLLLITSLKWKPRWAFKSEN